MGESAVTKHRPTHEPHPEAATPQTGAPPPTPANPAAEAKPAATAEAAPQAERAPRTDDTVERLRAELEAAKDREIRAHAELDNYRKRATRELEERLRYANMSLMRDLVPVVDNIERAVQAAEQNADAAALLDGFKMVEQQLQDVLTRHHCRRT